MLLQCLDLRVNAGRTFVQTNTNIGFASKDTFLDLHLEDERFGKAFEVIGARMVDVLGVCIETACRELVEGDPAPLPYRSRAREAQGLCPS